MAAGPGVVPFQAHVRPVGPPPRTAMKDPRVANPGMPDPIPGRDIPSEMPPRPFPGERPLGPDEPSAPFEEPPSDIPREPDEPPGEPAGPGIRA